MSLVKDEVPEFIIVPYTVLDLMLWATSHLKNRSPFLYYNFCLPQGNQNFEYVSAHLFFI